MSKLTTTDAADLDRLEGIIRRGIDTFYEVGGALAEIAERKLHRATHATFADYCMEVWGIGPSRGYQLIAAAKIVAEMSTNVETADLPKTEAQARELAPVPAEKRGEVMQEAAKLSAPKPPSAKDVKTAAKPYVPMAERLEQAEKRAEAKARKEAKEKYESAEEIAEALTKPKPAPQAAVPARPSGAEIEAPEPDGGSTDIIPGKNPGPGSEEPTGAALPSELPIPAVIPEEPAVVGNGELEAAGLPETADGVRRHHRRPVDGRIRELISAAQGMASLEKEDIEALETNDLMIDGLRRASAQIARIIAHHLVSKESRRESA